MRSETESFIFASISRHGRYEGVTLFINNEIHLSLGDNSDVWLGLNRVNGPVCRGPAFHIGSIITEGQKSTQNCCQKST